MGGHRGVLSNHSVCRGLWERGQHGVGGMLGNLILPKLKKKKNHEAASEWAECLSHTLLSLPKIVSFPGIHTAPFPGTEEGTVF